MKKITTRFVLLILSIVSLTYVSFSQEPEGEKFQDHFGGAVTLTNNGISLIPNLSLGKPAAIFDINVGTRLTFEPQFRFALEGKPWSFILWWRYRLLESEKFKVVIGAHPAIAFRTRSFIEDNISKDYTIVQRYLAGELYPTWSINKNFSAGIYILYAYCLDNESTKNTNLLALKLNFSNLRLSEQFYMGFYPQFYYLRMDDDDGIYFSSSLVIGKKGFPLSVSSMVSRPFSTTIYQDKNLIWNIGLVYSFYKEYVVK
jgi:hypothetical protein